METTVLDHLKSLHTNAIDAGKGYDEALSDAGGRGLTGLFREMIQIHDTNAGELAILLKGAGETADDSGSFMSTLHRAVISVRSLFGGLDKSVLPGLIDGEQRNVSSYDGALADGHLDSETQSALEVQRGRLQDAIATMRAQETALSHM